MEYIIVFNANGGEGEMSDLYVNKGDSNYLPPCEFSKSGYESMVWSSDSEGLSIIDYPVSTLSWNLSVTKPDTERFEVYAVWSTLGFSFDFKSDIFGNTAIVAHYDGTAKDIIMPVYANDHFLTHYESGPQDGKVSGVKDELFKDHTEIETVTNLTALSERLFYGCHNLKSVQCKKDSVLTSPIPAQAFFGCEKLTEFEWGDWYTAIGDDAFYNCTSFEKIVIPAGVTAIGKKAFYGWTENQTIEFAGISENIFGEEWLEGCNATIVWDN